MTFVYGATLTSVMDGVQAHMEFPDSLASEVGRLSAYAAKRLFAGVAAAVPAAAAAMVWLRAIAKEHQGRGRIAWTTPIGFPAVQDYPLREEIRLRINTAGVGRVLVRETLPGYDGRKMCNGLAPNLVHSLDSAHMGLSALKMRDCGHQMVAIHDSFGTHPGSVTDMQRIIREEFYHMYHNKNVLGSFLWDAGCFGEPPPRGNLALEGVLKSEFFFC